MSRIQGIATQNNQPNNQQDPHPGSLQHRNNTKNYIVHILRKLAKSLLLIVNFGCCLFLERIVLRPK